MADELTLEAIEAELARRARTNRIQAGANGDGITIEAIDAELARRRAPRNMPRSTNPRGRRPGAQTQPESTGYERARRSQVAMRTPASLGRGVRTFNETIDQIPAHLGVADEIDAGTAFLAQGALNLGRRAQGRPVEIPAADAARAAGDLRSEQTESFAREHPNLNTAAMVASVPAAAGRPTAAFPQVPRGAGLRGLVAPGGALRTGAEVTAINAPFALARQEGDLQERLPGAAQESALAFGMGSTLQGAANALTRQAPRAANITNNMDRLGIDPSLAVANNNGTLSTMTNVVSDNLIAGAPARTRRARQLTQTRDATQRIAQQYGQADDLEGAGRRVQEGLQRYATDRNIPNPRPGTPAHQVPTSEWGFASKARAVFDEILRPIEGNRGQFGSTQRALASIAQQADSPAVRNFRASPVVRDVEEVIGQTPTPTLRDLRELRRKVREAADTPNFSGQSVDNAALQRIEAALTDDIYAAAGPAAANLRKADAFYRRGIEQRNQVLAQLDPSTRDPGRAVERIISWMMDKGSGNVRNLAVLRRSLPDDQWRDVAATVISRLGRPTDGAAGFEREIGFSVLEFARKWNGTSERARRIMFGGSSPSARQLYQDLNDLAQIVNNLKGVARGANSSGTATHTQTIATGVGLTNPGSIGPTIGLLAGGLVTGEMLTNPAFVRWLTSASRTGASVGGARQHLAALSRLAGRDPALMPLYTDLARRAGLGPDGQPRQQQAQPQLEPAL